MALQAAQMGSFPVENKIECIHQWIINGDVRVVRLLCEGENNLICQVFNRVTHESSQRIIRYMQNGQFESLSAYSKYISANMRPELCSNRLGLTCTAMLVQNSHQLVHRWCTGLNGEVEVKLFHRPASLEGLCIAMDTASNKQKIFSLTKNIGPENAHLHEPSVTYDVHGALDALNFLPIHPIVPPQAQLPLFEPSSQLPSLVEPMIHPVPVQVPSSGAMDGLPPADSEEWVMLREWDIDNGRKVRFFRFGDRFISKHSDSNDFTNSVPSVMPILADISADELCADICERSRPFIQSDGHVNYSIAQKGRLNDDVIIDEYNWGVTLADFGTSKDKDSSTWGGHAVILIETIGEDCQYHIWKGHAVGDEHGMLAPSYKEIEPEAILPNEHRPEKFARGKTWIRTRELVQAMMDNMKLEFDNYKDSGISPGRFNETPLFGGSYYDYNCMKWVEEKLHIAKIRSTQSLASTILPLPSVAIGSTQGTVQKVVTNATASIAMAAPTWGGIGFLIGGPPGALIAASIATLVSFASFTTIDALADHIEPDSN